MNSKHGVDVDITEITSADIEMALRNMKNGKAAGPDNLPVEVWKRPCEKRKHQGETEGREYHKEVQESATEVGWPRKEARPRLRMKKDSGDGTILDKKARKTEAEMDGLCQPRHESHRNDER